MTKFIAIYTFIFVCVITLETNNTLADVSESQKPEVEHLLEFVETTDCTFERNGKQYNGGRAAKHIKRKYKHFRDEITTTEEFIEYSGTRSTRSGMPYLVYCSDSDPIESSVWLLEELTQYREKSA